MSYNIINKIVENDICIGCGMCIPICPVDVLEIDFNQLGEYTPTELPGCLEKCTLCMDVCPFDFDNNDEEVIAKELYANQDLIQNDETLGYFLETYVIHTKNKEKRMLSASGGFGNWLLYKLIETKEVDYVICLFHWGGRVEKGMYPDFNQPNLAYKIIDSGADLIIGHHSHTLQPFEVYKGKYIFYSLGNFCFSDIYSDGKIYEVNQDTGSKSIIVDVVFSKDKYNISLQYIKNKNLFIELDNNLKTEQSYLNRIKIFNFIKNKKWLWNLYWIKHKHYNPIKFYFFGNNKNPFIQLKKLDLKKVINYILKKLKGKI